jgi:hypothetical protein
VSATIHRLPVTPIRALPDDTLRSDCERLMRRLVKDGRTPRWQMQVLADVLDHIIERAEPRGTEK